MGFCLFEEVDRDGYCMAVNPAFVDDITLIGETRQGWPVCRLEIGLKLNNCDPIVLGSAEAIHKTLMQGVKIGMGELHLRTLSGQDPLHVMPMLFSRPDRIALIKERMLSELNTKNVPTQTASSMYLDSSAERLIADRPGTCAFQANAENKVPFLDMRRLCQFENA